MNSLTGQSFKSINQNCVIRGIMDQVRFAGTIGRLNFVDLVKCAFRLRNPAQVAQAREAHIRELSWLVVSRELEEGPGRLGQANSSDLSELLNGRDRWLRIKQGLCMVQKLGSSKMSNHRLQAGTGAFCAQPESGPLGYFTLDRNRSRNK